LATLKRVVDYAAEYLLKRSARLKSQVLTFHRVSDENNGFWPDLRTLDFARLLEGLSGSVEFVTVHQIAAQCSGGGKPRICITFDDGYRSFIDNALPILERFGIPSTQNINPSLIDENIVPWPQLLNIYLRASLADRVRGPRGELLEVPSQFDEKFYVALLRDILALSCSEMERFRRYLHAEVGRHSVGQLMTWEDVRRCHRAGVEIGNHSATHPNLAAIDDLPTLNAEILQSKARIEAQAGCQVSVFAFPNGLSGRASLAAVEAAGHEVALISNANLGPNGRTQTGSLISQTTINMGAGPLWREWLRLAGFRQ
jgi:peptidoglycan/xylan/chitin deacetylase (PgdA/CDA1 family)